MPFVWDLCCLWAQQCNWDYITAIRVSQRSSHKAIFQVPTNLLSYEQLAIAGTNKNRETFGNNTIALSAELYRHVHNILRNAWSISFRKPSGGRGSGPASLGSSDQRYREKTRLYYDGILVFLHLYPSNLLLLPIVYDRFGELEPWAVCVLGHCGVSLLFSCRSYSWVFWIGGPGEVWLRRLLFFSNNLQNKHVWYWFGQEVWWSWRICSWRKSKWSNSFSTPNLQDDHKFLEYIPCLCLDHHRIFIKLCWQLFPMETFA